MGEFTSQAALHTFLTTINSRYGKYAEALWSNEVRSHAELGNASVTSLTACGLSMAHAEDVQVFVNAGGMQRGCWICSLSQIQCSHAAMNGTASTGIAGCCVTWLGQLCCAYALIACKLVLKGRLGDQDAFVAW